MPKVQILLATYNGANYLRQQLDSILAQSYQDWEILARDDGSTDETMEILRKFQAENPSKMQIIDNEGINLGPCQNFACLMRLSTSDIVMFADQDDIWHADKIEKSVKRLEAMETEYGNETPLLVHHDFTTIDGDGEKISSSYDEVNKVGKADSRLNHILIQNTVTGFSMCANRALIDLTAAIPQAERSHDAYIGLAATTMGKIDYIPEQLADYRLHGNNVCGGKNPFHQIRLGYVFQAQALYRDAHKKLTGKCDTARLFVNHYNDRISDDKRRLINAFASLADASPVQRKATVLREGFFPKTRVKAALFFAMV